MNDCCEGNYCECAVNAVNAVIHCCAVRLVTAVDNSRCVDLCDGKEASNGLFDVVFLPLELVLTSTS